MWGNLDGIATFATECAAFQVGSETWALKTARYFEEGRFHTEELCTAGVCDQVRYNEDRERERQISDKD